MQPEVRYQCYKCQEELVFEVKIGRRDTCPNCDAYLHSCRNCRFWDPGAHNQCREVKAEYIRDREDGNFCGHFKFRVVGEDVTSEADAAKARLAAMFGGGAPKPAGGPTAPAPATQESDARSKLEALFKK